MPKLNVTIVSKPSYAEERQPNPLKWYILKEKTPGNFVNVSAPIVCKDFFNDLVYTLNTGKGFSIYGFTAQALGLSKDVPIYMLLQNTTPTFVDNINKVLNPFLLEQGMPEVSLQKVDNGEVLKLDSIFWQNTYYISLVSLMIRLLNIDYAFTNIEEMCQYKLFPAKDQHKWDKVVQKKTFFKIPEKLKDYIWYVDGNYNSQKTKDNNYLSSLVHNNGVLSWGANW